MNLLRDPLIQIITQFAEMEGMPWVESSFRSREYSLLGALHWLDEVRREGTKEADRCKSSGDDRDWPDIFADLTRDHVYTIYGQGGVHRYMLFASGVTKFSRHHSTQDRQIKAAQIGFDVV